MWRKKMSKINAFSQVAVMLKAGVFLRGIPYILFKDKKYKQLDPVDYLNWAGTHRTNYKFDVVHPRTMGEKINWLFILY